MKSFDRGGNGVPLHFLHANGYPPECYNPLFKFLESEYRVFGVMLRPLWDEAQPQEIKTWHPLSDDLLRFLSDREAGFDTGGKNTRPTQPTPVIGVGHSLGAIVTLRAALRDPRKFRALVLIDPVLFIPSFMMLWMVARAIGLGGRTHPLIKGALKRRRHFDDLETVFNGYRSRRVFSYMDDESLWAYINGITKPSVDGNGFDLVYSPDWEVKIYRTNMHDFDIWRGLGNLEVPTLFIRGAETDTFRENAVNRIKKIQPNFRVEVLEKSTHLLPLERPKEISEIMRSFLKEVL